MLTPARTSSPDTSARVLWISFHAGQPVLLYHSAYSIIQKSTATSSRHCLPTLKSENAVADGPLCQQFVCSQVGNKLWNCLLLAWWCVWTSWYHEREETINQATNWVRYDLKKILTGSNKGNQKYLTQYQLKIVNSALFHKKIRLIVKYISK